MKGDFSRLTDFSRLPDDPPSHFPLRHFAGWLHQQGRVWVDADWNADVLTRLELLRRETLDIVGECGAPEPGTGFLIAPNPNGDPTDFLITPGRYYVQGVLCELDDDASYLHQPDYPSAPAASLPTTSGQVVGGLIYLETWRRLITYSTASGICQTMVMAP